LDKCTRLDIRAERNNVLSPTQYGLRKEKDARDCLAILTTDINNSFEIKEQTVVAFLDISGTDDNVIIDILCEVMVERELEIHIIRLLWNLLKKKKKFVFYVGVIEYMSCTGYKGLPQGSVLSPFLYSLLGSGVDRFIPAGYGILQYADNVVVYASHRIMEIARALVQTACSAPKVFFGYGCTDDLCGEI
jgi:hypothetical protein